MSNQKPKSWFVLDTTTIQPPSFVPNTVAPEWVRTSIGNRHVTPCASILPQTSISTKEDETDQLIEKLEKFTLNDIDEKKFTVDLKVLSTLFHVKWIAPSKSKHCFSKLLYIFRC